MPKHNDCDNCEVNPCGRSDAILEFVPDYCDNNSGGSYYYDSDCGPDLRGLCGVGPQPKCKVDAITCGAEGPCGRPSNACEERRPCVKDCRDKCDRSSSKCWSSKCDRSSSSGWVKYMDYKNCKNCSESECCPMHKNHKDYTTSERLWIKHMDHDDMGHGYYKDMGHGYPEIVLTVGTSTGSALAQYAGDQVFYVNGKVSGVLHLQAGKTYLFDLTALDQSVIITDSPVGGPQACALVTMMGGAYYKFTPTADMPKYLYYQSPVTQFMGSLVVLHGRSA